MSNVAYLPGHEPDPSRREAPRGPQVKDGYTRIANELLEQVMAAPLTLREMRVVMAIIRLTFGWNRKQARVTGGLLAKLTGIHATTCAKVLSGLIEKRVLIRHGGSRSPVSLNKHADQWQIEQPHHVIPEPKTKCPDSGQNDLSQSGQNDLSSKDRKDMNTSSYEEELTADADSPADEANASRPKTTLPACPHSELLDLWAEIMPDKRQPIRSLWSKGSRAKNLAARWKQCFTIKNEQTGEPLYTDAASGIEWWGRFFRFLRRSEFLMRDDSRFFGLDWIAKSENFEKIMELKYHGGDS